MILFVDYAMAGAAGVALGVNLFPRFLRRFIKYQYVRMRQRQRDSMVILELARRLERVNNDDSRGLALAVAARAMHRNMRLDVDGSGDTMAMVDVELVAKLKQEVDTYLRGELDEDWDKGLVD